MDNEDIKREDGVLSGNPLSAAEIGNIRTESESAPESRGESAAEIGNIRTESESAVHVHPEGRAEVPYEGAVGGPAAPGLTVTGADAGNFGETASEPEVALIQAQTQAQTPFYSESVVSAPRVKKTGWGKRVAALLIACTLGAGSVGVGAGVGAGYVQRRFQNSRDNPDNATNNEILLAALVENAGYASAGASATASAGLTYADMFAYVAPSVVSIATLAQVSNYFNMPETQAGAGSGIIFYETDLNVYIVTNYHVVSGASDVTVAFGDSGSVAAVSVGSDSLSDVAVVSVSKADMIAAGIGGYSVAAFGDSDLMKIGDPVMAIGNAMNEGTSATTGIVSGVNKEIPIKNRTLYAIQTNAAINPGNSGGPLINTRGEVIGMNTAKLSNDNPFSGVTVEGMGYSMTSNAVKPIVEEIMRQKQRPFLGILGTDLTQEMADQLGILMVGVLVDTVFEGSSAEAAGLQPDDIITSFNGTTVFTMQQLQSAIKSCQVGDTVDIKALRGGKTPVTLRATLRAYQDDGNF